MFVLASFPGFSRFMRTLLRGKPGNEAVFVPCSGQISLQLQHLHVSHFIIFTVLKKRRIYDCHRCVYLYVEFTESTHHQLLPRPTTTHAGLQLLYTHEGLQLLPRQAYSSYIPMKAYSSYPGRPTAPIYP